MKDNFYKLPHHQFVANAVAKSQHMVIVVWNRGQHFNISNWIKYFLNFVNRKELCMIFLPLKLQNHVSTSAGFYENFVLSSHISLTPPFDTIQFSRPAAPRFSNENVNHDCLRGGIICYWSQTQNIGSHLLLGTLHDKPPLLPLNTPLHHCLVSTPAKSNL